MSAGDFIHNQVVDKGQAELESSAEVSVTERTVKSE